MTELDVELLVIALVPDLDSRFERLYGYLNDDVTRRRATVGLALSLADVSSASSTARARLLPGAPLIDRALVQVEDVDRPFLTRALRVPDRVAAHLLGDDAADPALVGLLTDPVPFAGEQAVGLARALTAGQRLIYVREAGIGIGPSVAAAALQAIGRPVVGVDLARAAAGRDPEQAVAVLGREALLRGAGVVAGPVEALSEGHAEALRLLADLPLPVTIVGTVTWDPNWTDSVPLVIDAPTLSPTERIALWATELGGGTHGNAEFSADGQGGDLDESTIPVHFVLGPGQVSRAVRAAAAASLLGTGRPTAEDLRRGARAQNAAGLERLARRIEPAVSWDDIVLPESARSQLHDLASRARNRDRVLIEWKMRKGGGRGRGVTALFAGDSGTGKTMSAEVIAGELGLDLYTVNLATVVDKYVGETEKNLERIFAEAGGVNAVLLFDEADAIFGKRSEVRDAHDRYANIESAYLLQRMETFDGLAVLATNLRSNIDDAFTRRLDMIIDFPGAGRELPAGHLAAVPAAAGAVRARSRPGILCPIIHPVGRQHSLRCDHRRVPRRGEFRADRHARTHLRDSAGISQTRPSGAGAGIRSVLQQAGARGDPALNCPGNVRDGPSLPPVRRRTLSGHSSGADAIDGRRAS